MPIRRIPVISLLLCGYAAVLWGQPEGFAFRRSISGIEKQWHRIRLPDDVYSKTNCLADMRIFGFTPEGDTIEAPYLWKSTEDEVREKEMEYSMINKVHNEYGYYFTFALPSSELINRIVPKFKQQNFDWTVSLEGSEDQREWFVVVEDYRILSISNHLTDYRFTSIVFPDARYRYWRLRVDTRKEAPELTGVSIAFSETVKGDNRAYPVKIIRNRLHREKQTTELLLELPGQMMVNEVRINIDASVDYYRPVVVNALSDSVQTPQGWKNEISRLASGVVSSLEKNVFRFSGTPADKIQVVIRNGDNPPLTVGSVEVSGNVPDMVARFDRKADYFLYYGKPGVRVPEYDVEWFADKILPQPESLSLGDENCIAADSENEAGSSPLFDNKLWMWAVMALIIAVLGWFSLKMLGKS
ncbi:MAG: DUF3999 domain-containing protein [Bacteroidales bacterium]|jgi:hypothetical protein|nr:DUF3999 domain-containing protein [Bacteroidales bacterium]